MRFLKDEFTNEYDPTIGMSRLSALKVSSSWIKCRNFQFQAVRLILDEALQKFVIWAAFYLAFNLNNVLTRPIRGKLPKNYTR